MKSAPRLALATALALTLALTGCTPGEKKEKAPPKPKVAAVELPNLGPAPKWKLQDLNGKPVSSDDLKGKVVVVDFWATWCAPCVKEIPSYIALQQKHAKDGLVVVGVSLDQAGVDVVKAFGAKMAVNYPLVMADEDVQAAFGGLNVIPTTFLIDRTGQIRDRKEGFVPAETYEQRVLALLGETGSRAD